MPSPIGLETVAGRCLPVLCVLAGLLLAPAQEPVVLSEAPELSLIEAVRTTLVLDPVIRLQDRSVALAEGRLQEERGRFDARLSSAVLHELSQRAVPETSVVNTPLGPRNAITFERFANHETTFRVGLDQPFRSGIVAGPGIEVVRSEDNVSQVDPRNRAGVNFTVVVPLLRGLGRRAATARERAARIELDASRLVYQHTLSERILNTTAAYWAYLSAERQLAAFRDSEERAATLLENTRSLVEAEEIPAAELDQLEGNLAGKTRLRIAAEQRLFEARQDLGLSIGLGYERIDELPPASNDFPGHESGSLPEVLSPLVLFQAAMDRRADVKATLLQEESASTLLYLARNNLKPQVDLTLRVGYEGLDAGNGLGGAGAAFVENVEGVNGLAALSFDWPPANRQARGQLQQQQALYDQSLIRSQDLARTIRSALAVALQQVRHALGQLAEAARATRYYRQAVRNEKEKQRLGLASFTDVLLVEDRLTAAEIDNVQAQQAYATAVVRLRFEAGLLLEGDADRQSIDLDNLTTLPVEVAAAGEPSLPEP